MRLEAARIKLRAALDWVPWEKQFMQLVMQRLQARLSALKQVKLHAAQFRNAHRNSAPSRHYKIQWVSSGHAVELRRMLPVFSVMIPRLERGLEALQMPPRAPGPPDHNVQVNAILAEQFTPDTKLIKAKSDELHAAKRLKRDIEMELDPDAWVQQ